MHFVPNPSVRWIAASVAVIYCAVLFTVLLKLAPPRVPDVSEKIPAPVKLTVGFPIFAYFIYVCFYMNFPAAYTQTFGSLARREYQIEDVKKRSARAVLCPYSLRLRGALTVLDDSFCVREKFALSHSPGQSIVLNGKQSALGFRFDNAS